MACHVNYRLGMDHLLLKCFVCRKPRDRIAEIVLCFDALGRGRGNLNPMFDDALGRRDPRRQMGKLAGTGGSRCIAIPGLVDDAVACLVLRVVAPLRKEKQAVRRDAGAFIDNLWLEDCTLTGGASGGPWMMDMQEDGVGTLISVNSWGFAYKPGMAGPNLSTSTGSWAECLYTEAKRARTPGSEGGYIMDNC